MNIGNDINLTVWEFGGEVPQKFDDHINRSIPGYEDGHELICQLSNFFIRNKSTVYEIGCSTGTLSLKLSEYNKYKKDIEVIGIDIEPEMIKIANSKLQDVDNVKFINDNVLDIELKQSDLIVCYYTLQFINPAKRQDLLDKLYQSLNPNGALILFEKVRASDAKFQDIMTSLYLEYKLSQGYTADEVLAKMRSLKGILDPMTEQENINMLTTAGFNNIETVAKHICFTGFLAIK